MAVWILAPRGGTCCACRPNVCDSCAGGCTAPTLVCDSISASLTKCGYDEWPGYVSTPPKVYSQKSLSGSFYTQFSTPSCVACVHWEIDTYSGSCVIDSNSCALTSQANVEQEYAPNCTTSSFTNVAVCSISDYGTGQQTISYSSTVKTVTGTNACIDQTITIGAAGETLSSEYTTAALISNTVAALPSYPNTFTGTCSSYRNLSSDELTYSIRRFKYKFILPSLSGCSAYAISWMEGSTPRSYTWNGTDTETPVYGPVLEPSSNGSDGITSISVTCTC